jgi:hypothetical protein
MFLLHSYDTNDFNDEITYLEITLLKFHKDIFHFSCSLVRERKPSERYLLCKENKLRGSLMNVVFRGYILCYYHSSW